MGEIWQIKTKGRDLKSLSFVARKYCKKWDFLIDFQTHCDKLIFLSSIQSGFTVAWSLLCSQSLFVYRENLPSKSNFHNQRPKPCRHPFKSTRKKKFSLKFLIQNMYVVFFFFFESITKPTKQLYSSLYLIIMGVFGRKQTLFLEPISRWLKNTFVTRVFGRLQKFFGRYRSFQTTWLCIHQCREHLLFRQKNLHYLLLRCF